MEPTERVFTGSEDEKEEHVQRLMALLHELVRREGGREGAARALGIVKGGVIMDRRGGCERPGVALQNWTTRRLL